MTRELTSNVFDTALIFEGGGMRASYTSAVANVLIENGIFFDNVYGLSAGSSNAVNYLSRDTDRTRFSFVGLVEDPQFGGLDTLLQHKGYFSAEYIYQKAGLPGGTFPFDFETFAANPAKLTIEAFDRDTGESVYWTRDDMPTLDDMTIRVRASSSLPMFMPPPNIDGHYYYDGGLGEGAGFLLPKAQRDGFERFFIVCTRPRGYRKKPPVGTLNSMMNAALWGRPHVVKALKDRWWKYNRVCDEIEELEAAGKAYVFYAQDIDITSAETNLAKLQASHEAGCIQAAQELPRMKEFLGLS